MTEPKRWDAPQPDLLLASAYAMKEARAIRPSIDARMREAYEREKYEKGLPNDYEAVKTRNNKIRNGRYHFDIVEEWEDPEVPFRHTRFVLD